MTRSTLPWQGLCALALLLGLQSSAWAQGTMGPPPLPAGEVVEIEIVGTRRVEALAVRNVLGTEVGETLSREQIRRDIMAIRRLRTGGTPYFEDVQVDVSTVPGGLRVSYILKEKPIVARFNYEFTHGDELEDDLEEVVDIDVGDVFDLARVRENIQKIEELYREEGYYLAEADFYWVDLPSGDVALTIRISEYDEVQVRRVSFVGNEEVDDDDLQSIMATRPGDFLSFLSGAGVFNEIEFGRDRQRLRAYYYDQGYVDVEVGDPMVELSRDLSEIYITIPIVEGPQYSIRDVGIRGDLSLPAEEMMAAFVGVEPGETFSSTAIRQDIERLTEFYQNQGYAHVNVNLGTQRDAENRQIGLVYDIQQGLPVYIGRIVIQGNSTTRDEVIRREMRIHESDLYNGTAIQVSRARIERLGYFETVDIREVTQSDAQIMDLEVEVVERPTGQFQVGAGFSSVESFIATATIAKNNLFGRGQSLSLQASISALRTIFSLSFSEPYLFGTRWQFSFEIFNREVVFTDFTRSSFGFGITVGHPIGDDVIVSGTYQLESVDVEPGGRSGRTDRQFAGLFEGGITSSVTAAILWDTRNNRLFPSAGWMQRGSVEWADDIIGSENQFLRFGAISRWYWQLFDFLVLKLNANLGYIVSTDPGHPVPIFERYFIGGPNSVRGFERASLSPTVPVANNPNDPSSVLVPFPIGGNKSLFFNFEIEFPILTALGVRGVVFADMGNAFSENQSLTLDMDVFHPNSLDYNGVLRTAVGFGFRWFSPIGPLRFEWGFPLSPLPWEDTYVFEFSIGNFL